MSDQSLPLSSCLSTPWWKCSSKISSPHSFSLSRSVCTCLCQGKCVPLNLTFHVSGCCMCLCDCVCGPAAVSRFRGRWWGRAYQRKAGPDPVQHRLQLPEHNPHRQSAKGPGTPSQGLLWHLRPLRQNLPAAWQEAQAWDQGQEEEPQPSLERNLPIRGSVLFTLSFLPKICYYCIFLFLPFLCCPK